MAQVSFSVRRKKVLVGGIGLDEEAVMSGQGDRRRAGKILALSIPTSTPLELLLRHLDRSMIGVFPVTDRSSLLIRRRFRTQASF